VFADTIDGSAEDYKQQIVIHLNNLVCLMVDVKNMKEVKA
jgi:hypothetical protein